MRIVNGDICVLLSGSEISGIIFGQMRKVNSVSLKIEEHNVIIFKPVSLMLCNFIVNQTFQENMPNHGPSRQ